MMRHFNSLTTHLRVGLLAIWLTAAATGCSRSPRVTFYTLEPTAPINLTTPATTVPNVAIGPITIPELVNRPQMVVRVSANRVDIQEMHRWAGPLKSEINSVIAGNLRRLLGSKRVSSSSQYSGADTEYRVLVDIQRFESSPVGEVTVEAVWSLRRSSDGPVKNGHSLAHEPFKAGNYDAMVAAYDQAILSISRDLAQAIISE